MLTIVELIKSILPFDWLEPSFMRRALVGLLLISPACAVMGVQVVSFRMAFFSDAISHSAFTGVALGLLLSVDPRFSMIGFGIIVGCGVLLFARKAELSTDTVIGVFFAAVVALGIVIVSAKKGLTRFFTGILFGDILTIDISELWIIFALSVLIFIFQWFGYNRLLLVTMNSPLAQSKGIRSGFWEMSYGILLALLVMVSLRAVGLLLVTALLVVPAAAGRNFARTAGSHFWWSAVVAIISSFIGLYFSFIWGSATGATVILVSVVIFIISFILK